MIPSNIAGSCLGLEVLSISLSSRNGLSHISETWLNVQDESQDYIKRQQLRELAMLNSNFREESPGPSGGTGTGSVSPFNSSGMKRAKTGR